LCGFASKRTCNGCVMGYVEHVEKMRYLSSLRVGIIRTLEGHDC